MAFCTNCGATVTGAFCNQCGTAARAAGAPPPPAAQPSGSAAPPATVPAGPPARKTSPIVWVLVIVLGLVVLGGICVVGAGLFFVHKARQAGVDPELVRSNPGVAIGKMIAAFNPDVDVVRTDNAAGTITLRDRRTGKEVTISFDQARSGKFTFSAEDDRGKTATVEIGGSSAKLPSWLPAYPGATPQTNIAARGESNDGAGQGGNFTFTTKDSTGKVMSFYQDKTRELGMKVRLNATGGDGATLIAEDEDGRRTLTVLVGSSSGETTVNVTYASKH